MLIKKMYQGEVPENKIVGTKTSSNTDAYNCTYVNSLETNIKNLIKTSDFIEISLSSRYNYTTTGWADHIISLDKTNHQSGNITRNGNKVVIGKNISYVLCIGIGVDSTSNGAGAEHDMGFIHNGSYKYGHTYESPSGNLDTHTIANIIPVKENDYIQLYWNTGGSYTFTIYEPTRFIVIGIK